MVCSGERERERREEAASGRLEHNTNMCKRIYGHQRARANNNACLPARLQVMRQRVAGCLLRLTWWRTYKLRKYIRGHYKHTHTHTKLSIQREGEWPKGREEGAETVAAINVDKLVRWGAALKNANGSSHFSVRARVRGRERSRDKSRERSKER